MKKTFLYMLFLFLLTFHLVMGQDSLKIQQLEQRIKQMEDKIEKNEIEDLKREAETVSARPHTVSGSKTFKGGQRSLQALNPEISITGDGFNRYIFNEDNFTEEARSGSYFRVVGFHIQSNLDPFSTAKAALEFTPHGFELGEAYLTWHNVLPGVSLTAGKFRQQFGAVNRWHAHGLDQFDFPLAMTTLLGEEGLNQTGFSVDWLMPSLVAHSNSLTIQITNGQNEHLFAGENFSFPVILGRLKNYYDLNANTYLELGITGMVGQNNFRGYEEVNETLIKTVEDSRLTTLGGADLTVLWEPVNKAHYHSFLWRSELYYVNKEMDNGNDITAFGGYTYGEYKLNERWQGGIRFDYTQPFEVDNDDHYLSQIVPYVTWWQSHWVKLRLQYNHLYNEISDATDKQLKLQIVWAVGPHKHDRY